MIKRLSLSLFAIFAFQFLFAQQQQLTGFPKGSTPNEVGKRLAYHFVDSKYDLYFDRYVHYASVCTWNGALDYALKAKDNKLIKLLQDKFEPLFTREKALLPPMNHVDYNMFGSIALKLYQVTKDERYRKLGLAYADSQWEVPKNAKPEEKAWAEKGFSWQTRLWIDDMYMITVVQKEAYKVTGDRKYIDRAAKEMVLYLDELQRPNGLFYHAPDVPYYWGRGDGWMAVGMPDLDAGNMFSDRIEAVGLTLYEKTQLEGPLSPQCKKIWLETQANAYWTSRSLEEIAPEPTDIKWSIATSL
ncbi:MAG: glycosyl hydrolase, partial [Pedobacter sp.]